MRTPLLSAAAVALALAVAEPAAAVGCSGTSLAPQTMSCTFDAVSGTQLLVKGVSTGVDGTTVTVTLAYYSRGVAVPVASCTGNGLASASCSATAVLPRTGTYVCSVSGYSTVGYSCTPGT